MKTKLPWWTWVLPLIIFQIGTQLSLPLRLADGTPSFYFPLAFGFVLIQWWGPRVLPALFLNAAASGFLWGWPNPLDYPLYALAETFVVATSWGLVKERLKDQEWSPTPQNMIYFAVYGLLIPCILNALCLQSLFVLTDAIPRTAFLWSCLSQVVSGLLGGVGISLPLLLLGSPLLKKMNLSQFNSSPWQGNWGQKTNTKEKIIFAVTLLGILALSTLLPLQQTWYLLGTVLLLYAVISGLEMALLLNTWIIFLNVAVPAFQGSVWNSTLAAVQVPATLITLCFSALIAGASVSELKSKIARLLEIETQLKLTSEEAAEASRAKSDFLERMSHEIRTPLNSVLGILELLRETHLSGEQERYLTLFSHAGENLKALINDLLDFSKIETKTLTLESISYDLNSTVRSVFEILQLKAEEKGLQFEIHIASDVPPLQWGDPTRIRQVLFNLVGNAIKFTQEGRVSLNVCLAKHDPSHLLLEVRDTGLGIPRDKQATVFKPFFQTEAQNRSKYGGPGLGLVISKNLVEVMGGTLEMKSLAGRGTTFTVSLPHRPDLGAMPTQKIAGSTTQLWPSSQRYRILLVDDSEDNRILMTHYFKDQPFDCEEATNGQEAVERCERTKFDLILMDMQMPVMSGYRATELIRHREMEQKLPPTVIIALTANAMIEDLQRALQSGCDAYLVKPVKKSEVLAVFRKYLLFENGGDIPPTAGFRAPYPEIRPPEIQHPLH